VVCHFYSLASFALILLCRLFDIRLNTALTRSLTSRQSIAMLTTRLLVWFLLTWLSKAADIVEGGIQAELEANQNNLTALQRITAPPWVSEPSFRGTTSILWSCLVALLACIYTAIHLNVPTETGTVRHLLQKAKWVLTVLFAPEIVLYCASTQFLEARRLVKALNALEEEKTEEAEKFHFDLKYGFFVVMRGIEVSIAEIHNSIENIRLSPKGVLQLAKLGYPLYVSKAKIDDKGKANLIQKSLVILQVTWMATQCATRRAYGLPLTLLEIHTMVHVVCALTMYLFWFYVSALAHSPSQSSYHESADRDYQKPLDIAEPQHFDSGVFDDILALMVSEQFHHGGANHIMMYPPLSSTPQDPTLDINSVSKIAAVMQVREHDGPQTGQVDWVTPDQFGCTLKSGQALKSGIGFVLRSEKASSFHTPRITLSLKEIACFERAWAAITRIEGQSAASGLFHPEYEKPRYPDADFISSLVKNPQNLPQSASSILDTADIIFDLAFLFVDDPLLFALLLLLPAVYGGVHLTAWNFEFPSDIERLLWKIACFDIISTMVALVVIVWVVLAGLFLLGFDWTYSDSDVLSRILRVLVAVLMAIYGLCRMFLVVESFISLRKVPIGVYWTPSWLQMIPHV
jgi:hypothetical protein